VRHRIRSLRFRIARIGLVLLAGMAWWGRPAVTAGPPVVRGPSTPVAIDDQSRPAANDVPDMVPVSRLVPRAKTISPVDDRERRNPSEFRTTQSEYRESDDAAQPGAGDQFDDDVPPPATPTDDDVPF